MIIVLDNIFASNQINIFKEFNSATKKLISEVNKTSKNATKSWDKLVKQKELLEKTQQTGYEIEDEGNDVLGEVMDAADALGVNPQAVEGYGELDKVQSEIGEELFNADDQLGNINRA